MPFVDNHQPHVRKHFTRVGPRENERQTFWRRDESGRHAPVLSCAFCRRRVAGSQPDAPRYSQFGRRALQRASGIGGECAHWRDPQHGERFGLRAGCALDRFCAATRRRVAIGKLADICERGECAKPYCPGFARAGSRVQQTARATRHFPPDIALKLERLPAACVEPGLASVGEWALRSGVVDGKGPGFESGLACIEPRLLRASARHPPGPGRATPLLRAGRCGDGVVVGIGRLGHRQYSFALASRIGEWRTMDVSGGP